MTKHGDWFRVPSTDALKQHISGVHLGIIDHRAVTAFTFGWCWALAYSFESTLGLPPVVLVDDRGFTLHAGVLLADGQVGDIEGTATFDEWKDRWELREVRPLTVSALGDKERSVFGWLCGSDEERAVEAAGYFIDPCLNLWGLDRASVVSDVAGMGR